MKNTYPFVYIFTLPEKHITFLKDELIKTMEPTRKNEACLFCDMYQDKHNPCVIIIHELWTNIEGWRHHMIAPYCQEFTQFIEKYDIKLAIHALEKII